MDVRLVSIEKVKPYGRNQHTNDQAVGAMPASICGSHLPGAGLAWVSGTCSRTGSAGGPA